MKFSRRTFAVLLGIALVSGGLFVPNELVVATSAQAPSKRPLSYDIYDSWRAIAGTRLSDDGQWLAYALTSQGEDGTLIVRNLKSNQEFKAARGTAPQFTPDGKLLLFTIVPRVRARSPLKVALRARPRPRRLQRAGARAVAPRVDVAARAAEVTRATHSAS
jgi:hypothetical protein